MIMKYIAIAIYAIGLIWGFTHIAVARESVLQTHTTASCTNSTGLALAANAGRISALLINDATTVIYLRIGADAVANEGIRLNANGGSYYISDKEGNLDTEVINCITPSATNVLLVIEWSTE